MAEDRTITYPAKAVEMVRDEILDCEPLIDPDEVFDRAFNIVTEVTRRVDALRAIEARERVVTEDGYAYKVVAVISGERREMTTRDRDEATDLWRELHGGSRNGNGVERVWCERSPLGEWQVFTSELGTEFSKIGYAE